MHAKYVVAVALAFIILFSASIPVYASHTTRTPPTEDEKRLFEKIFDRLEEHDELIEVKVDDVKKTLSEPLKIFFSCRTMEGKSVESVTIDVSTRFVSFDKGLAEQHKEVTLGGVYIWDCKAVKDSYTLTIECTNLLMLNPSFMLREETESDEKKLIAMAENEMMLYHEFLHGQLMINAMKDNSDALGWRANACSFFASNNNEIDYSASDAEHQIISGLEVKYLAKLIEQSGGIIIVKTIDKQVGAERFTQLIANFDELGELANAGFFVFARTTNLEGTEILVSREEQTISVSAILQDPQKDGGVRMFIMPKAGVSDAHLELEVDDTVKSIGSEFVFTARVHNKQTTDIAGSVRLIIDGFSIGSKELSVPAGKAITVAFTWSNRDKEPAVHSVKVDGFNKVSNGVTVMTFDRFVSATAKSDSMVAEQSLVDPNTGEKITVAVPNKISATITTSVIETDVRLFAPDGTLVIGKDGLVNQVGKRVNLVEFEEQTIVVKYTDLNEKLRFFAVKNAKNAPLPEGEWVIKAVDISGNDADVRIKYYVSYIAMQKVQIQ
jgi:hypothetical protein